MVPFNLRLFLLRTVLAFTMGVLAFAFGAFVCRTAHAQALGSPTPAYVNGDVLYETGQLWQVEWGDHCQYVPVEGDVLVWLDGDQARLAPVDEDGTPEVVMPTDGETVASQLCSVQLSPKEDS